MNTTPFDIATLNPPDPVMFKGSNDLDVICRNGRHLAQHSQGAPTLAAMSIDDTGRLLMLKRTSPFTGLPALEVPKWRSVLGQEPEQTVRQGLKDICGASVHPEDVISIGLIHPDASYLANATNILFIRIEGVFEEHTFNLSDNTTAVCLSFSEVRMRALEDDIQDAATIAGIFRLMAGRR